MSNTCAATRLGSWPLNTGAAPATATGATMRMVYFKMASTALAGFIIAPLAAHKAVVDFRAGGDPVLASVSLLGAYILFLAALYVVALLLRRRARVQE